MNSKLNNFQASILFLIDHIHNKGGTEKHLYELSNELANKGHNITVVSLSEGLFGKKFKNKLKNNYKCLNVIKIYNLKGIISIIKLIKIIHNKKVRLVQTFHSGSDIIGPIISILSFRKIILISSRRDTGHTKNKKQIIIQKKINKFFDRFIANSNAVRNSIINNENLPSGKINIIYNGVNTKDIIKKKRPNSSDRLKIITIGSLGNARPIKGYDVFISAARILLLEYNDIHFYHAGTGDLIPQLKDLCKKYNIENKFTFLGHLEIPYSYLSSLDIYVQPSLSEGFSNSILEAMATGLPVIATNVDGNREIIEDNVDGYLIPPKDPISLAKKISLLIENKNICEKIGRNAKKKVFNEFSNDKMIGEHEDLYLKLIT